MPYRETDSRRNTGTPAVSGWLYRQVTVGGAGTPMVMSSTLAVPQWIRSVEDCIAILEKCLA